MNLIYEDFWKIIFSFLNCTLLPTKCLVKFPHQPTGVNLTRN
jgi:hypothetical protein